MFVELMGYQGEHQALRLLFINIAAIVCYWPSPSSAERTCMKLSDRAFDIEINHPAGALHELLETRRLAEWVVGERMAGESAGAAGELDVDRDP